MNPVGAQIINNVFASNVVAPIGYSAVINGGITFAHNLWINGSNTIPLISTSWASFGISSTNYMTVKDNIFYNVNAAPDTSNSHVYNWAFNNNLTFSGGTLPTLPSPTCVGSGNINNVDPQFISIFNTTNILDFNLDNLRLQSTSPAHNAATDGTDIGPTGGTYPIYRSTNRYLTGEPTVPEVKSANFTGNSSVIPGGSLQIQVKATKIN